MARTIRATKAQVLAAKLIVERADRGIGQAGPAVRALAEAQQSVESHQLRESGAR